MFSLSMWVPIEDAFVPLNVIGAFHPGLSAGCTDDSASAYRTEINKNTNSAIGCFHPIALTAKGQSVPQTL